MTFDNPEVIELGMAEELIREDFHLTSVEGEMQQRIKEFSAIYMAEAE
ncbi:MAG TPA: hypothetical protein VFT02_15470 [Pyrinomonadaceae bacterium]|nr:hypothetical protein [Pyrinomonadaceae bacterium]